MIGPEDIQAFADRWGPAIKAASEYARRKEKGTPPDRWADGTAGAVLVADGIRALQVLLSLQNEAIEAILRPSGDATGVFNRHGERTS